MYLLMHVSYELIISNRGIGFPNGWEMRKDTEPYQLNFQPPGVEVHCLYGVNVTTVEK